MTSTFLPASHAEAGRTDLLERRLRRFHPRFQGRVRLLAARHPRIADLAASFPALFFALAVPRPGFDPAPAIAKVIAGHSLAEVAATAALPMWARKLSAEAFTGPIPKLPNGDIFRRQIGNYLPRSPMHAAAWLQAVATIAEVAHEPAALWMARTFVREPKPMKTVRFRLVGLWAWFSIQPATFAYGLIEKPWSPDISIGPAVEAAKKWQELTVLNLELGFRPIADMWLNPGRVDGYDFLPLDCAGAIVEEAAAMKNCVRTYGSFLAHDYGRLWSVQRNGEHVATLKIAFCHGDPLLNVVELKGPGNVKAPRELWWVARQWLHMHDVLHIEKRRRKWNTASLDHATWLSLWRPYWLAKRSIPDWLPLRPTHTALWAL